MTRAAYIHIPFCQHICHYCDFNKVLLANQPVDQYLDYLEKEMQQVLQRTPFEELDTIFVGGGTPTALSMHQTEKLLSMIESNLKPFGSNYEYTFEANPGDLPKEKLQLLLEGGVNRLSFGIQTFDDGLLKKIGRSHTKRDAIEAIEDAKKVGFTNISGDLIYALPDQTIQDVKEALHIAMLLELQHMSAYSLIVEPKTVFYNLMKRGNLHLPSEDHEANMYEYIMQEMEKNQYHQYEISNFAKSGYESRHNITYWNNESYYGFGAGAHSYVSGQRIQNAGPLKQYFTLIDKTGYPHHEVHDVTKQEKMEEEMFLGLRKTEGVSKSVFKQKFHVTMHEKFNKQIQMNKQRGYIEETEDTVRLTKLGTLLGNEVFQSFLLE
ncbi:radical SAM family heme chaperone HemW [Ectobacillus sp. sgz5001026]|uniref:radical SAM family heme chaperone HemW n=1 Tax=Ectobacillus sp. sgz5001026 TaxID=3242473 RepID=UPI0036D36271